MRGCRIIALLVKLGDLRFVNIVELNFQRMAVLIARVSRLNGPEKRRIIQRGEIASYERSETIISAFSWYGRCRKPRVRALRLGLAHVRAGSSEICHRPSRGRHA